jgi:hypothetical protein
LELVIKGVSSFKFKVPSKERCALGTWNLEFGIWNLESGT